MKEIKHVEIYYADDSMERISNEETTDKKLTQEQVEYMIDGAISDLNNFRDYGANPNKVTIDNYKESDEDDFSDMQHSHFRMCISILDALL